MVRALSNPVLVALPQQGVDGRTVLAKARAPLVTDGRIGDFWIDTVAKKLYGPKNASGWPDNGLIKGDEGWTPVFGAVVDGSRRVQRVVDWVGGQGSKPAVGKYVGPTGLVDAVADAIDIRGSQGPEMLISSLTPGSDSVTYETLVPHAETGDDNKQNALKDIFSAGGEMPFKSVADAMSTAVPARVGHVRILDIATTRVRVASEPTSGGKHRSADRFLPNGEGTDSANGGWWADDEAVFDVYATAKQGASADTATQSLPMPGLAINHYEAFSVADVDRRVGTGDANIDTAAMLETSEIFGDTTSSILQRINGGRLHLGRRVLFLNQAIKYGAAGVRIIGEGIEASKIYAASDIGNAPLINFAQTNNGYSNVGCEVRDVMVDMQGHTGHGIQWVKPYDGFNPTNISVYGIHADYNAFRIIKDPANSDPASQTATLVNLIGAHVNSSTATGDIFYFEALQEAVLLNCKAFGAMQTAGPATLANCSPFRFVDCRGVQIIGCSSAFSQQHGIKIEAKTRASAGFTIIGHTYETINGMLRVVGTAGVANVSRLEHASPRYEGAGANAAGSYSLSYSDNVKLEVSGFSVNGDHCDVVEVHTSDVTNITYTGTNLTILGRSSAANGPARLKAASVAIETTDAANRAVVAPGGITFTADGPNNVGGFGYPYGAGQTGLKLAKNVGGTVTFVPVTIDTNGFLKA